MEEGSCYANGEADEDREALEQLRFVFNLCDGDQDGVISVDEFRQIGRDHFDKTKPMEVLIQQIDPQQSGRITFTMFRAGIENFLISRSIRSRSTSQGSSSIEDGPLSSTELSTHHTQAAKMNLPFPDAIFECSTPLNYVIYLAEWQFSNSETFASDSIHPLFPTSHMITNGYSTDSCSGYDLTCHSLSGDGEEGGDGTPLHSSPLSLRRHVMPASSSTRDNPSLLGRVRQAHHNQLTIPGSPGSKSSTPAEMEPEEMVSQLSDQLLDLSSKLEHLEADHRSSHGARERLRREKEDLRERMEEYEDQIRSTELLSQRMLQENSEHHAVSISRLRRESQAQLDDLTSQLMHCREEVGQLQLKETNLISELTTANKRLEESEGRVGVVEERGRKMEEEVERLKEQLHVVWTEQTRERETHAQAVQEFKGQIHHWQKNCEEIRREKKRRSLTVSDMDTEVSRLNKEVEKLKRDNDQLQARFLQHGKDLISHKIQSLADEMEDASKDDVMKALRDTELHNARLHEYIEGLLVSIIDKHPELLEKR